MIYTSRTFPLEFPLNEATVALVGVPWDSSEIGASVKHGPLFIREALKGLEGFDPETGQNIFEKTRFCDLGDVEVVPGNWELTRERIADTVDYLFKENPGVFPVFLGGDHLITLAVLKGLKKAKGPFTIVHFDAHADLSQEWLGERFSHITWGSHALKMGFDIVQYGVRSMTVEEHQFIEKNKHRIKTLEEVNGPLYVTVDLDVFDPGFAPEVGTPEPLGMEPKEFFGLLKNVCERPLMGMDIVECASTQVNTPTALLAAQVIKKVLTWKRQ